MSHAMTKRNSEIYGLMGFTHHGWAKLITAMGPAGDAAVRANIAVHEEALAHIKVVITANGLTQYHGKREGALERLIEDAGIIMLTRDQWNAKKAALK